MPIKQGINFRNTAGYVTDGTDHTYEILFGTPANYPRTTPQGFTVGWEVVGTSGPQTRNRSTSIDTRLAGTCFNTTASDVLTYRVDLPNSGSHDIRIAAGDNSYARSGLKIELFDDTTSLGILVANGTTAGGKFRDATDAELTAAAWPAGNTKVTKTFASQIARFKLGNGTNQTYLAHLYIEGVAAGGALLGASGSSVATGIANLSTSINLAASGIAVATGMAALATSIKLAASGNAVTTGTANLSAGAGLSASGSSVATGTASLLTGISLSGSGNAITTGTGGLLTAISLSASGSSVATGSASLTTGSAGLSATGQSVTTGFASLTTQITLLASGNAVSTGTANLNTGSAGLSAAGFSVTTGTAFLTTGIRLAANGACTTTGYADLLAVTTYTRAPDGIGTVARKHYGSRIRTQIQKRYTH